VKKFNRRLKMKKQIKKEFWLKRSKMRFSVIVSIDYLAWKLPVDLLQMLIAQGFYDYTITQISLIAEKKVYDDVNLQNLITLLLKNGFNQMDDFYSD